MVGGAFELTIQFPFTGKMVGTRSRDIIIVENKIFAIGFFEKVILFPAICLWSKISVVRMANPILDNIIIEIDAKISKRTNALLT